MIEAVDNVETCSNGQIGLSELGDRGWPGFRGTGSSLVWPWRGPLGEFGYVKKSLLRPSSRVAGHVTDWPNQTFNKLM